MLQKSLSISYLWNLPLPPLAVPVPGLHWETLQKMLAHSQPPGYRRVKKGER